MLTVYMDTSVLVSLYAADANSTAAAEMVTAASVAIPLTPFGRLELINAIHLRRFRKEITPSEARGALAAVASDLSAGVLSPALAPAQVYERARMLADQHTALLGVRTLDILHVAAALELRAERFYTFDQRQARLARAEGLTTPVRLHP